MTPLDGVGGDLAGVSGRYFGQCFLIRDGYSCSLMTGLLSFDLSRHVWRTKDIQFCGSIDEAPSLPGAYMIAIELAETIVVTLGGRAAIDLSAGRYLYCGSAKGPGGLKARLSRHLRHGKSVCWHVDQLTERGSVVGSWIFPGGDECDLVAAMSNVPAPIPGFGSTDCRRCRSHLLRWSDVNMSTSSLKLAMQRVSVGQGAANTND